MKNQRWFICPNYGFKKQLLAFEKELKNDGSPKELPLNFLNQIQQKLQIQAQQKQRASSLISLMVTNSVVAPKISQPTRIAAQSLIK